MIEAVKNFAAHEADAVPVTPVATQTSVQYASRELAELRARVNALEVRR
jgi:hypothetical protein